jgi:predicted KAP-like P-loop ATPase
MTHFLNDTPIENPDDDRYGVMPFAEALAQSILNIDSPIGTTIAIHGPWGSGKSSTVNLIRAELAKAPSAELTVSNFRCWWYRGEEALALAFLQELYSTLRSDLGENNRDLIPQLTKRLLQAGPVIGQALAMATGAPVGGVVESAASWAEGFLSDGPSVESIYRKLAEALEKQKRRYLVIIDDIDRLQPDEALAIFRLVKSVGLLPNVVYLLVFDRELAEKAVRHRFPSEGPHYLEKIIQAGFDLPLPMPADLHEAVLDSARAIFGFPEEEEDQLYFMNMFYDAVAPYMLTPRHVTRLQNALSVTWPAIGRNVNRADFLAMEAMRLNEPMLFNAVKEYRHLLYGTGERELPEKHRERPLLDRLLDNVSGERKAVARASLQRLFPALEDIGYGSEFLAEWDRERRVCIQQHFENYLRLSLSDATLPADRIDELIANAGDRSFVAQALREAAETRRRSGKSMVPVYLDALATYAKRIDKAKVGELLQTLFSIHDEIDLTVDEAGPDSFGDTSTRIHWLMNSLVQHNFDLKERSALLMAALGDSSLGWLINFEHRARKQWQPGSERPTRVEERLLEEGAVAPLKARTLRAIHAAASGGQLIKRTDIVSILYCWRELDEGRADEPVEWVRKAIDSHEGLMAVARSCIGHSYRTVLGDKVSRKISRIAVESDSDIIDMPALAARLEKLRDEHALGAKDTEDVNNFLDAWARREEF